jgi:hypothetical protein
MPIRTGRHLWRYRQLQHGNLGRGEIRYADLKRLLPITAPAPRTIVKSREAQFRDEVYNHYLWNQF